jgi:tetratricopeptide (TPR) repeat protein
MNAAFKIGLACTGGLLLSGCGILGIGGHHSAGLELDRQTELATAEAVAEIHLDVGRENLREGNLATAARYLREAQLHPTTRAEATNALGVVYIRLGRLDVAQRYFADAVELEPENARYMTNLARIERDVSFAELRAMDRSQEATQVAESTPAIPAIAAPVDAGPVEVARANRVRQPSVIHITTTASEHAAPNMQLVERRPVIQVVDRSAAEPQAENSYTKVSQAKIVEYPIRIEL